MKRPDVSLFGMLGVRDWPQFSPALWVDAVLTLTVVRMLRVEISLIGTKLSRRPIVLFMGWFGPRGLASIVLGLVYMEEKLHLRASRQSGLR